MNNELKSAPDKRNSAGGTARLARRLRSGAAGEGEGVVMLGGRGGVDPAGGAAVIRQQGRRCSAGHGAGLA